MRTIIAGSRSWVPPLSLIDEVVRDAGFEVTEVVSGHTRGVDSAGEEWAQERGIPLKVFPADWDKYRRAAGPMRNQQMAEYADAIIAFWDGSSRGTKNMIEQARKHSLKVHVYVHEP